VWTNPPAVARWYKHQADTSFPALQQKVSKFPRYAGKFFIACDVWANLPAVVRHLLSSASTKGKEIYAPSSVNFHFGIFFRKWANFSTFAVFRL
jgi:hypothetical protein